MLASKRTSLTLERDRIGASNEQSVELKANVYPNIPPSSPNCSLQKLQLATLPSIFPPVFSFLPKIVPVSDQTRLAPFGHVTRRARATLELDLKTYDF